MKPNKSTQECLTDFVNAWNKLFHEIAKELHLYQLMDWLENKLKGKSKNGE